MRTSGMTQSSEYTIKKILTPREAGSDRSFFNVDRDGFLATASIGSPPQVFRTTNRSSPA
ncbi:hypothetical protein D3C78_1881350 [compost metagenome]